MGGLFGNDAPAMPAMMAAPVLAPVTPMPVPDDASAKRAARKKSADRARASGRAATILSQQEDDVLGA